MSSRIIVRYLKDILEDDIILLENKIPRDKILKNVEKITEKCTKCPLLKTRKKVVFGQGNPYSDFMFVGEAPGEEEDKQGIPFVGRAGQKLNQILKECGIDRKRVYITNVLKCRPPGNRNPTPFEVSNCFPYLHKQITLIKPKVIVCLGRYASWVLTGEKSPVSEARKNIYENFGSYIFVTYHPSAILRKEALKTSLTEDIKRAFEFYLSKFYE